MRTIKVFGFPSHGSTTRTSGVDFVRVIQPIALLNNYTHKDVQFETRVFDPTKQTDQAKWDKIADEYDVIYLNYVNNPRQFAAAGAMAKHFHKTIICDLDDNLWNIKKDNQAYNVYKPRSAGIYDMTQILKVVDHVTTTNSYLKNAIIQYTGIRHEKVTAIPNYIDLDNKYIWRFPAKPNTHEFIIGHFGSTTHFLSQHEKPFVEGVSRFLDDYPEAKLRAIGSFISSLKHKWGRRYETLFGHQDIYEWINKKYPETLKDIDVFVTPLTLDVYNRSKSSVKYLEASAMKKPGVWQRIRQYEEIVDPGVNGYLAENADDWYNSLVELFEYKKRLEVGEAAFKTVEDDWTIQKHLGDYADMIVSCIDNKEE